MTAVSFTDGRAEEASDFDLVDTSITFNMGETTTTEMFTIDYDNEFEYWEDFSFSITVDAGSDPTSTLGAPSTSTVIIRDRK